MITELALKIMSEKEVIEVGENVNIKSILKIKNRCVKMVTELALKIISEKEVIELDEICVEKSVLKIKNLF